MENDIAFNLDNKKPLLMENYSDFKVEELQLKRYASSYLYKDSIKELAFDTNIGILHATRNSEIKIAKQEAEKLLELLRSELGIAKIDISPEESIHIIKLRLMNLCEMMSEAQITLCKIDHRVTDIEGIIKQLPEILNSQRDQILSIRETVAELEYNCATKTELNQLEKEFKLYKWSFGTIIGFIITLVGLMLSEFIK